MANSLCNIRFIIILLFTAPLVLSGQEVLFNKTIDFTPQVEGPKVSVILEDGSSVSLVSYFSSVPGSEYDSTMLIKIDRFGCIEWKRNYYFHEDLIERELKQHPETNHFFAAVTYRQDGVEEASWDIGWIEFDENGNLLDFKTYGWDDTSDTVLDMLYLDDGGWLVVGKYGTTYGFVLRIDAEGEVLWEYKHNGIILQYSEVRSVFSDVQLGFDNNFWITANTSIEGSGTFFFKIDPSGVLLETISLFPEFEAPTDIIISDFKFINNDHLVVAATGQWYDVLEHTAVSKFDENLDTIWTFSSEPYLFDDRTECMLIHPDGNIFIGGWERTETPDLAYFEIAWIKKLSLDGELLWDKNILPKDSTSLDLFGNRVLDLHLASDGNILATGFAQYILADTIPYLNAKIWAMKIDTDGNYEIPLSADLSISSNQLCPGDSSSVIFNLLSTNGCYDYEWSENSVPFLSDESEAPFFLASEPGIYQITLKLWDETGQELMIDKYIEVYNEPETIVVLPDTLILGEPTAIFVSDSIEIFNWSGNGSVYLIDNSDSLIFVGSEPGLFDLNANFQYANGLCASYKEYQIFVADTVDTGIHALNKLDVLVFPNPAREKATFRFPSFEKETSLTVLDALGQLKFEADLSAFTTEITIPFDTFSSGIYYWSLGKETGKLVVEQ